MISNIRDRYIVSSIYQIKKCLLDIDNLTYNIIHYFEKD